MYEKYARMRSQSSIFFMLICRLSSAHTSGFTEFHRYRVDGRLQVAALRRVRRRILGCVGSQMAEGCNDINNSEYMKQRVHSQDTQETYFGRVSACLPQICGKYLSHRPICFRVPLIVCPSVPPHSVPTPSPPSPPPSGTARPYYAEFKSAHTRAPNVMSILAYDAVMAMARAWHESIEVRGLNVVQARPRPGSEGSEGAGRSSELERAIISRDRFLFIRQNTENQVSRSALDREQLF